MSEEIKVHVMHLGDTSVDELEIFPPEKKPLNPLAWAGIFRSKKHQRVIPCTGYLIEHPKGTIVYDTGFDKRVRTHPVLELTAIHNQINKPLQEPGQAVDEVLKEQFGLEPKDIDILLLSHLHSDHANGARQLKDAKRILVSRIELEAAKKQPLAFIPRWRKGLNFETFEFEDTGLGPVGKSYDLFGDGTMQLIWLPGHTEGMYGIQIRNNGKELFLCADCGYGRSSYREIIIPSVVSDVEGFRHSLEWLGEHEKQDDVIDILPNHDPDVEKLYII